MNSRDDHYNFTSADSVAREDSKRIIRSEYGLGGQMRRTDSDVRRAEIAKAWAERKAAQEQRNKRARTATFVLVFVVLPCMIAWAKGWIPWAAS